MIEVVAEIGINHSGDLEIAKKLIDVAHAAGVDYVKFQKRDIDLVYTKEELDKPRESLWGETTREQKEGLEFGKKEYSQINMYCDGKIEWFASIWDINSADFIMDKFVGETPFIKIPSALITDINLLKYIGGHYNSISKQIILSTGMSTLDEVDKAIEILGKDRIYCIMHCTSTYPTDPEEVNVTCINTLKERYPWTKIGFSNHYPGLMAMVLAATFGAEMIETHITLDRTMVGSDHSASIEPQGLFDLIGRLKLIEQMKGDGVKKIYDSEIPIMRKLRKNA